MFVVPGGRDTHLSFETEKLPPMGLSFSDALRRFESYLRVEKNLSPKTRNAYIYDLNRFSQFVYGENANLKQCEATQPQPKDVQAYIHYLREDLGYRPTTLSRTISSLRVFFDFLIEEEVLHINPCRDIQNPKQSRKLPVYLVEGELRKLFEAPDLTTPLGIRDRTMMVLLSFCGMRLQELVGLNTSHVSFESRTIRVMGKGSKERLIPMNEEVVRSLTSWMEVRKPADGEQAVFVNRFGHRLSGRMVEKIVDKYVSMAGLKKTGLSPHKLRHTFATLLHSKDVDLVEIQSLLGHSSIATTQIYTHTDKRRLKSAVEKLDALDPSLQQG